MSTDSSFIDLRGFLNDGTVMRSDLVNPLHKNTNVFNANHTPVIRYPKDQERASVLVTATSSAAKSSG